MNASNRKIVRKVMFKLLDLRSTMRLVWDSLTIEEKEEYVLLGEWLANYSMIAKDLEDLWDTQIK